MNTRQALVGAGTAALGAFFAVGATQISSAAGYGGVGPNFLPWVVGLALLACGVLLVWEAASGGFRVMDEPSGGVHGHWPGFVWVSSEWREPGLPGLILAFLVTLTAGVLMVSRLGYPSFKGFDLARPVRFVTLVLVVAAFAIIAHNPGLTLLAVFGCFAAWAPLHWLWRHLFRRRPAVVVGGAPADEDTD